jgi:hypothetical protein
VAPKEITLFGWRVVRAFIQAYTNVLTLFSPIEAVCSSRCETCPMTCNHRNPADGEYTFLCPDCGELVAGLPRDYAFLMPDIVFDLSPQQRRERATQIGDDFWSTAPEHYFVRCLLPIPLFDGEEFCFGVWVDLCEDVFRNVLDVWDDLELYPSLEFEGSLANRVRVPGWTGYGVRVHLAVRNSQSRPFITWTDDESLQRVIDHGWSQEVFERYSRSLMAL